MGRVIFINTLYYPDPSEVARLDFIQEQLELYHAEIAFVTRSWDEYKRRVYKESSHRNIQKTWYLIKREEC